MAEDAVRPSCHHIAICVCTYQRPKMLAACLESLAMQLVDDSLRISIIVVDNEVDPNNRRATLAFTASSPFPVHYEIRTERKQSFQRCLKSTCGTVL